MSLYNYRFRATTQKSNFEEKGKFLSVFKTFTLISFIHEFISNRVCPFFWLTLYTFLSELNILAL